MKSLFAKGCLFFVLLLIAGGGYLLWRLNTAPKVAEDFRSLTPEVQQQRRSEADKALTDLKDVARRVHNGDKSPFRLVFSEQVLNTLLQDRINTDKFPIHDLRVGLENNQLALQGILPYKGVEVTATLTGSIQAKQGKIDYKADSLIFNGLLRAPEKWQERAEAEIDKGLNNLLDKQNFAITRAAIENKKLHIEGTPR